MPITLASNLGLIGGIIALIFGIVIMIFPKILNYLDIVWGDSAYYPFCLAGSWEDLFLWWAVED
jgi:hypothetical protein